MQPTDYFRAIRQAPDYFQGLSSTQFAILFRTIYRFPPNKTVSMSRYRLFKTFKIPKTTFYRAMEAIVAWQRAQGIDYLRFDKQNRIQLASDQNNIIGVVAIPASGTIPTEGNRMFPPRGIEVFPPVGNRKNIIEEHNQHHKGEGRKNGAQTTKQEVSNTLYRRLQNGTN